MLGVLNDYCQLAIIKYLNLSDQLALSEASENDWKSININLISAWKQQSRIKLSSKNCETLKNNRSLLSIFLSSISVKVEEMELVRAPMEFLKSCENYSLQRVQILSYTLDDSCNAVEAQKILTNIFPGVRCVTPDKHFCYCLLPKWTQFRKLVIRKYVRINDPTRHCELPQSRLIEELVAPDFYMIGHCLTGNMYLPKLRTITICLLDSYAETRNPTYRPLYFLHLLNKYGVTKDKIRDLMLERVWCYESHLCGVVKSLRNLVRLGLDRCSCSNEKSLWKIVAKRPSLEILDITSMNLGRHFFSKNRRLMNRTMRNRHAHLKVIYANIGKNEVLIRRYFTHPRLQLIPDHKNQKNVLGPIIKVESNPLHEI
ncbi:uncharacterized protein LOC133849206 isoform X1 [Drosophila sulfurigaster albostrigata]|uniref:uncharacterized protein LOC133849206 isoform X1 n=1 Tax=Drosophila sulfurigaster albostrigata TaxID=89887 RepID=UPI002D21C71B|nr:uncharacterized protein LOC133849206 isoform X1 [Drosophila sulfurigaster albostrigata]